MSGKIGYGPGLPVDEGVLKKLAIAVQEARGDRSQREFSKLLEVSQSTVQQWENGKNVPSLENLEKIARMKGMLVEDFVAYLYDRTRGITSKDILDRVEVMPSRDFAQILHVIGDRLAPPEEGSQGKGAEKGKGKRVKAEKRLRLVRERQKDAVELGE
ncbi:helix-turn-helix domain-containing protein [Kovacikia minuta CCNUW1]|uniref:helix-turn-helix transcriptional regulator n=1 Tax=Kovacikia minuta TaxID=2931930 RepID=UPI001CCBA2DA|nr:helix-turn-helix transcriptional regulator [Kovacikia minuta]UBF27453.1 helix-turn-helix domain-containing protein [Kovacikia minuta CCNUW1]